MDEMQHPYEVYLENKAAADRLAAAFRTETEKKHGSIREFHKKLQVHIITRSDDPRLSDYHKLYSQLFAAEGVIPMSRLAKAIDRSHDKSLQKASAPFRYELGIICDPETGEVLAGTNYVIIASKRKLLDNYYHGTMSGNFTFVTPKARSLGLSHLLQETRLERARAFFGKVRKEPQESMRTLIFNDHHDPLSMKPSSYMADNQEALIDQFERMAYWQGRGYRRLSFDYKEPPGIDEGEPLDYLCLNVCSAHELACTAPGQPLPPKTVSAKTILFHLRGFYTACRRGKHPPETDPIFREQKRELTRLRELTPSDDREQIKLMQPVVLGTLKTLTERQVAAEDRKIGEIFGLNWEIPASPPRQPCPDAIGRLSRLIRPSRAAAG